MNLGQKWLAFLNLVDSTELEKFRALLWLEQGVDWPVGLDLHPIIYEGNLSCTPEFLCKLRHCCLSATWDLPVVTLKSFLERTSLADTFKMGGHT